MPGPGAPDYDFNDTDGEALRKMWNVDISSRPNAVTAAGLLAHMRNDARPSLPEDDAQRGLYPMAEGCLDYFPNAIAEVSRISYEGNQKHNPGQPMHWSRGKSIDHRNKIIRHTVDSTLENEAGVEHAAQAAWRALAYLQEKIERVRAVPVSRGSRVGEAA